MKNLDTSEISTAITNLSVQQRHDIKNKLAYQVGWISLELDCKMVDAYKEMNKIHYKGLMDNGKPDFENIQAALDLSYQLIKYRSGR